MFVATVALCGVALCVAAAALLSTTESEGETGLLGVQSESLRGMPGFCECDFLYEQYVRERC